MPSRILAGTSRSTMTASDSAWISTGMTQTDQIAATNANDIERGNLPLLDTLPPCAHPKPRNSRRQPRTIAIAGRTQIQCLAPAPDQTFKQEKENQMRKAGIVGFASVLAFAACMFFYIKNTHATGAAAPGSGYKVSGKIPVAGEGGWDYLVVDSDARRLYHSHYTHTVVYDVDSHAVVGDTPDTQGVHGIALAPELGRGFVSNGRGNSVTIFDLKTLKTIGTVPAGTNPDAILYDGVTKRVFAFNGRSKDATVIDAAEGKVLGTFPVGGKPQFAAADGKGSVYVNVEDTSELLHIDAQKMTVLHRWPLAPCKEPSGLAMDTKTRRLFAVFDT